MERSVYILNAFAVITLNILTVVQGIRVGCGGSLTSSMGDFGSPGYFHSAGLPAGQYPNNRDCEWIISTSAPGTAIELTFIFFDLEPHANCLSDYVELFGGPDMSNSLGKFCGDSLPPTITSDESMRVVLHTDGGVTKRGFYAWYRNKHLPKDCSTEPNGLGIIKANGRIFRGKCEDGWLYVAVRKDGSVDFDKNWQDFKNGFGAVDEEHFLGFENIRSVLSQGNYEMRTSFTNWDPETRYIDYEDVTISNEATGYRLKYKCPATKGTMGNANGIDLAFTTKDKDNDSWGSGNCAVKYKGPGWFGACLASNQFGPYLGEGIRCPGEYLCMTWGRGWPKPMDGITYDSRNSFKGMTMKIKPKVVVEDCPVKNGTTSITTSSGTVVANCDDGWLVIAHRFNGQLNFHDPSWNTYKKGFGSPPNEYFIGFDAVLEVLKRGSYKIRFDLGGWNNEKKFAEYSRFFIGDESTKFRLALGHCEAYSTAWCSLDVFNYQPFSTKDRDHSGMSCTSNLERRGPWWYSMCGYSNLFSAYPTVTVGGPRCSTHSGCMKWWFPVTGVTMYPKDYFPKEMKMKIKRL